MNHIKAMDDGLDKDRFSIVKRYEDSRRKVLVESELTLSQCASFPAGPQADEEGEFRYVQVLTSQLETMKVATHEHP